MEKPERSQPGAVALIAGCSLVLYVILTLHGAFRNSATTDELLHLASGWTALHWRDYRLNPEHPPLGKLVAALAVESWMPSEPPSSSPPPPPDAGKAWTHFAAAWDAVPGREGAQWYAASMAAYPMRDRWLEFLGVDRAEEVRTDRLMPEDAWRWNVRPQLFRARAAMLLFPLALAAALFAWGRLFVSATAASGAVLLLSLDPSFIAHGGLVTTDVAAAAAIFACVAALQHWLSSPRMGSALLLMLAAGTAATVKFTSVVLAPLLLLLVAGWWASQRTRPAAVRSLAGLLIAGGGAFLAIWLVYGLRWSATVDGKALPVESLLQRRTAVQSMRSEGVALDPLAVRARALLSPVDGTIDRVLLGVHGARVLPEAFTHGLAFVRAYAAPRPAYLHGTISDTGFPLYFAWAFLYKTTPALLIGLLIAGYAVARRWIPGSKLWWLCVPPLVLVLAAAYSGVNIGHRHILVVYPFLWLLVSESVVQLGRRTQRGSLVAALLMVLSLAPVFVVAGSDGIQFMPGRHLAYMNELAGGPVAGSDRLSDSNVDWGQDAYRLADWWNRQEPRPLLAYAATGATDPRAIPLPVINTPFGYPFAAVVPFDAIPPGALLVVSQTSKSGVLDDAVTRDEFRNYLSRWTLVERVGFALEIYAQLPSELGDDRR